MFLISVITTIKKPTASVLCLAGKLNEVGGKLIVAGDKKGPADFHLPGGEWRVTGGESHHSKSNIQNSSSPNPWPIAAFFRYRLQSKKNRLNDIFRA
jgi:hypothetical protein